MAKITKLAVGEALVGDGNEVAHIDLIIGPRGSVAEEAFAVTLTNQKEGVNGLLAVLTPNLMLPLAGRQRFRYTRATDLCIYTKHRKGQECLELMLLQRRSPVLSLTGKK